ncbi:MAG: hypothetical protein KDC54_00900 [Lewinella sp.]|nr:hypothetical protein [Lewinella sp.]
MRYSLLLPALTLVASASWLVSCGNESSYNTAYASTAPLTDTIPEPYGTTMKGAVPVPSAFAPLLGRWQSIVDPEEVLHFLPGRYISYYGGEKIVEEVMHYHANCPAECTTSHEGAMEFPCFTIDSEYGSSCFALVKVSENTLELSLLGGPGNTLSYQRLIEE